MVEEKIYEWLIFVSAFNAASFTVSHTMPHLNLPCIIYIYAVKDKVQLLLFDYPIHKIYSTKKCQILSANQHRC